MSEFDPQRALREEIQGLGDVLKTLKAQEQRASMQASEAATQYDALCKLRAFAEQELARKQGVLAQLNSEAK